MNTIQNPNTQPQKKFNNAWIYIPLVVLLIGSNIFLYLQKDKQDNLHENTLIVKDSTIATLKSEYEASLVRLDDLIGKNAQLDSLLNDKNSEIGQIKARINELTKKQKLTEQEYREAKTLIASLQGKIVGYEAEIAQLKGENLDLSNQVSTLEQDKQALNQQLDLAKVLFASNITMQPIDLRKKGTKEVETSKAKKVDVLRINFDIVKNLLDESGNKEFFILIKNPDGELLSNAALGSGSFITAEGNNKFYSISKTVYLEKGKELKNISIDWNQTASYTKGNYEVEIYHKGFQVGNDTVMLK